MRLTQEGIAKITGYKLKSLQAKWFLEHLGVQVPVDRNGVIMTDTAYEKLIEKRLGLADTPQAANDNRPVLRSQRR